MTTDEPRQTRDVPGSLNPSQRASDLQRMSSEPLDLLVVGASVLGPLLVNELNKPLLPDLEAGGDPDDVDDSGDDDPDAPTEDET